jgi:ABC-2 type transport system permease protein
MNRFLWLLRFEIRKILSRRKALLFLLALNVIPLLASIFALIVFVKFKGWGMENVQYSFLVQAVKALFSGHMKFFTFISPFFLALVVGDSFSGEAGEGTLKTLLLTPVRRPMVILCKALAVLLFLLLAVSFGGLFLQMDLWIARALIGEQPIHSQQVSMQLVETATALRLLAVSFLINLTLVGFFSLFSLFFDSPIIMTFCSLIFLMAMQTYVFMAPFLSKIDPWYGNLAGWCFTRNLSELSDIDTITGILEKRFFLTGPEVAPFIQGSLCWAGLFFLLTVFFFQRKQILN